MSGARECGVCWYLYDPALGDDVWQIEAGTPFEALPAHWRCPKCDSAMERFLPPKDEPPATAPLETLVKAYEAVAERMRELPVFNPALRVDAVGFRDFEGGSLGVVVTPWFMNLVLLPGAATPPPPAEGEARWHALPAGSCEFFGARLEGVGSLESCSLFSPVAQFESPEVARATAEQTLELLFTAPVEENPPATPPLSRRELFGRLLSRE